MLAKYHLLLQQESTRLASSSEEVMLARFWDSEERLTLAKEKEDVQNGRVLELPPLPSEWSTKYEETYGSKPPLGVEAEPIKAEPEISDISESLDDPEFLKQEVDNMMSEEMKPHLEIPGGILNLKRPLSQMAGEEIKEEDFEEVIFYFLFFIFNYFL